MLIKFPIANSPSRPQPGRCRRAWLEVALIVIPGLLWTSGLFAQQEGGLNKPARVTRLTLDSVESQIQAQLQRLGDDSRDRFAARNGLIVWPKSMWVGVQYEPDGSTTKYLTVHLALGNSSDGPLQLDRSEIAVVSGGTRFVAGELPRSLQAPLRVDQGEKELGLFRLPDSLEIGPGEAVWVWCGFGPLPVAPPIPPMTLKVGNADAVELDLTRLAAERLALETTVVGPRDCLALIQVRGHLDALGTVALADEVQRLSGLGIQRAVVLWEANAEPVDLVLIEWLVASAANSQEENPGFQTFARMATIRQLHLAGPPVPLEELDYLTGRDHVHPAAQEAVAAALKELLPRLADRDLLDQLQAGHPWVQRAILLDHDVRLPAAAWNQVRQLLESPSESDLVSAAAALTRMNDRRAIDALDLLVRSGPSPVVQLAALDSLVQSADPRASGRLATLLSDGVVEPGVDTIRILSTARHTGFSGWIHTCLSSSETAVRVAALQGLDRLGDPDIVSVAGKSLEDAAAAVRSAAFEILAARAAEDPQARQIASDYALRALPTLGHDDRLLLYKIVRNSRDTRFVGPLLQLLRDLAPDETEMPMLIALLATIGDVASNRELVRQFPRLSEAAQRVGLESLCYWDAASSIEIARKAIHSRDQELMAVSARILRDSGDVQLMNEVIRRFEAADDMTTREWIAAVLVETNSVEARAALVRFRDRALARRDSEQLYEALDLLHSMNQHSPGWSAYERGDYRFDVDDFPQAIELYRLALEIDPQLAAAASSLGNACLRLDRLDEALANYRRALEIDPFDNQAITGVGIVLARQGQPEEGVRFTLDSAAKCPDNYVFEYNTACVYGRAVEFLNTQPASAERDALVRHYGEQAIQHLRKSIRMGFDDFALLESDPDLDALRGIPGFGVWNP